ncbi:MAG: hypothetical protein Q8R79_02495, partial [Legionellaceae bacterium]|nr:hypothetical protein [Legionellaceae bacterium]
MPWLDFVGFEKEFDDAWKGLHQAKKSVPAWGAEDIQNVAPFLLASKKTTQELDSQLEALARLGMFMEYSRQQGVEMDAYFQQMFIQMSVVLSEARFLKKMQREQGIKFPALTLKDIQAFRETHQEALARVDVDTFIASAQEPIVDHMHSELRDFDKNFLENALRFWSTVQKDFSDRRDVFQKCLPAIMSSCLMDGDIAQASGLIDSLVEKPEDKEKIADMYAYWLENLRYLNLSTIEGIIHEKYPDIRSAEDKQAAMVRVLCEGGHAEREALLRVAIQNKASIDYLESVHQISFEKYSQTTTMIIDACNWAEAIENSRVKIPAEVSLGQYKTLLKDKAVYDQFDALEAMGRGKSQDKKITEYEARVKAYLEDSEPHMMFLKRLVGLVTVEQSATLIPALVNAWLHEDSKGATDLLEGDVLGVSQKQIISEAHSFWVEETEALNIL